MRKAIDPSAQSKMNEAVRLYCSFDADDRNRAAEKETQRNRVWELFSAYLDDGNDTTLDVFAETLDGYTPKEGNFMNYFNYVLSRRKKGKLAYTQVKVDGEAKKIYTTVDSLDEIVAGEDSSTTKGNLRSDPHSANPELMAMAESDDMAWTQYMVLLARNGAKGISEERKTWYQMLYTEEMTDKYKNREYYFLSERDVFQAIAVDYLDYYMLKQCRSWYTVAVTPLKPYETIVPERAGRSEETKVPIPGDVSVAFRRMHGMSASEASHSDMKRKYKRDRKEYLQQEL